MIRLSNKWWLSKNKPHKAVLKRGKHVPEILVSEVFEHLTSYIRDCLYNTAVDPCVVWCIDSDKLRDLGP